MKNSITIFLLAMNSVAGWSQDQFFSNPAQSLLNTNPSFAGSSDRGIRNQFVFNANNPFASRSTITYYNGIDAYIKAFHGGLGVSAMQSNYYKGMVKNTGVNLIYAPRFECKQTGFRVTPSIQLSYLERTSQPENDFGWIWPVPIPPPATKRNGDLSAGLLINYKNFYVGGSVFHITRPDMGTVGVDRLATRYNFNTSYNIKLNQKNLLNLTVIGYQQAELTEINAGLNFILGYFIAGASYTFHNEGTVNIGFRNEFLTLTAAYGVNPEWINMGYGESYQLTCAFNFHKKNDTPQPLKSLEAW